MCGKAEPYRAKSLMNQREATPRLLEAKPPTDRLGGPGKKPEAFRTSGGRGANGYDCATLLALPIRVLESFPFIEDHFPRFSSVLSG